MAGNIIPAIATTNAMTAGLCVLQAFKVMRDDYDKAKMVFLTRSTDRVLTAENLHPPKPECPVCSVAQTRLVVDTSRATLKDLVEDFLRLELGYGEDFSVNSDAGVIYDPELDDNLPKKFNEIGLKADSFVTVIDEEDENPRVNLVLSITEQYVISLLVLQPATDTVLELSPRIPSRSIFQKSWRSRTSPRSLTSRPLKLMDMILLLQMESTTNAAIASGRLNLPVLKTNSCANAARLQRNQFLRSPTTLMTSSCLTTMLPSRLMTEVGALRSFL